MARSGVSPTERNVASVCTQVIDKPFRLSVTASVSYSPTRHRATCIPSLHSFTQPRLVPFTASTTIILIVTMITFNIYTNPILLVATAAANAAAGAAVRGEHVQCGVVDCAAEQVDGAQKGA